MNSATPFGDTLRSLRAALGLSQLALATKLSSTQRHLSFLETGRSRPTSDFLQRMCSELNLSPSQRGALFDASGFHNPYPLRSMNSEEITQTLDMIGRRILDNWPFPAFVLCPQWTVLRMNHPAELMFSNLGFDLGNEKPNLLKMLVSPEFRALVRNWTEASQAVYFRLLRGAEQDPTLRTAFDEARRQGIFDHIPAVITGQDTAPVYVPIELGPPDGPALRMASFIGQLASLQDSTLEGIEVELMVPLDDHTETCIRDRTAT